MRYYRQPLGEPAADPVRQHFRVVGGDVAAEGKPGADDQVVRAQVHGQQLDEPGNAGGRLDLRRDELLGGFVRRPADQQLPASAPSRNATAISSALMAIKADPSQTADPVSCRRATPARASNRPAIAAVSSKKAVLTCNFDYSSGEIASPDTPVSVTSDGGTVNVTDSLNTINVIR